MDVHLRDLRYFVAVAEHLHFTEAAEALYISQPALSKQIHALERQLRVTLFVRDRHRVALTPAGQALLDSVPAVLEAWAGAEKRLGPVSFAQQATLVVGISTGLGRGLLPAVRARLSESAPEARLQIRQIRWEDPTGGLGGEVGERTDAAFVWLPIPRPDAYEWIEVAIEDRLIALPADHRLAARHEIEFAELLDEPFLALPKSAGQLRDFWLAVDARGGRAPVVGAEIASTEETVEALTAGLGICLIAAGNAALLDREGVTMRPVTGISPSRLVLAWHRHDERPLMKLLRAAVIAASTTT